MVVVIKLAGLAGTVSRAAQLNTAMTAADVLGYEGYVVAYDPEAHHGRGDVQVTNLLAGARRFETMKDALNFAMIQPAARPIRDDGLPNRPLTAFNLEFIKC